MRRIAAAVLTFSALALVSGSHGCGGNDGGKQIALDAAGDGADDTASESGSCSGTAVMCGSICSDTSTDPANCGACGNSCSTGDVCCSSRCVTGSCGFAVTGLTPALVNQSGYDWVQLSGSGFAAGMTVLIGDGRAPVKVIDATHATIQTPPAVVGKYDVTIQNAGKSGTTHAAFEYVAAGVVPPWQKIDMPSVRGEHPALAVLQDGRVLIAGGTTVPDDATASLKSAVLFTRVVDKGTIAAAAGDMSIPRWRCSATTMLDGRALVIGETTGCTGAACKSGDVFDPKTNKFTPTAGMTNEARDMTFSVLMVDGRVMTTSAGSSTVEVYDPSLDSFTTIPMKVAHQFGQRIVRLRDGRVMVMGGDGCIGLAPPCGPAQADVDIYDPKSGAFTKGAPMNQGRTQFTAHTMPDGRVMVFGGASSTAGGVSVPLDTIEAYDPKSDKWTVMTYKLTLGRTWHASALVRDGTVLLMGGYNHDKTCDATNSVDQVDPVAGKVTAFATLTDANTEWNAVTLLDGSVVGVGGGACGSTAALPDVYFLAGAPAPK